MDPSFNFTEKDACYEILGKMESLGFTEAERIRLKNQFAAITDNDDRTNLIFFGNMSSGKTSSIKLIMQFLMNINPNEQLFPDLISTEAENTYFFFMLESSSSLPRISIVLSESEKKIFESDKDLVPLIKCINSSQYILEDEFPNTVEGYEKLNAIISKIDLISEKLLLQARQQESNSKDKEIDNSPIGIVKLQVPNFPHRYRLIDTPGLSLKKFYQAMQNSLIKESNAMNVFIYVHEITCQTMFNIDCEILKNMNDYGQPIIYSFITKGLSCVEKLKKGEKKDKKQYQIDRSKFLSINKKYFDRIKELKENGILFRKIIPIIDDDFESNEVKNCIEFFIKDMEEVIKNYSQVVIKNTRLFKIREVINNFNDSFVKKNLLDNKELNILESTKFEINLKRETELMDYFYQFDTFENYIRQFPDHITKLEKIYKSNKAINPDSYSRYSRGDFITKQAKDSIQDFQKMILQKAEEINQDYFRQFYNLLPDSLKLKIFQRFQAEGLVCENQLNFDLKFGSLVGLSLGSLGATVSVHLIRAGVLAVGEQLAAAAAVGWVPVVGWTITGLLVLGTVVSASSDYIGIWSEEETYNETTKILFDWFHKNKGEILEKYVQTFNKIIDDFINSFKNKKETSEKIRNLIETLKKVDCSKKIDFEFKKEDLIELIQDEFLKSFILEALGYESKN